MADLDPAKGDHAIIAGIGRYPDLPALRAARADARRFRRWILSTGVPEENVWLAEDATHGELNAAFQALCKRGERKVRIGRRLYLYLSGHGFAQHLEEASLLAADGGPAALDKHIPGESYARWFQYAAYFKQVVLFADCCRTAQRNVMVQHFPLPGFESPRAGEVIVVRGYAVGYDREAIEIQTGKAHGVFTRALLRALDRAHEDGRITAASVKAYLHNDRSLEKVRARPYFSVSGDDRQVVFSRGGEVPSRVLVSVADRGIPLIEGGPPDRSYSVKRHGKGLYRADLPRGIYAAKAGGRAKYFEVTGQLRVMRVSL